MAFQKSWREDNHRYLNRAQIVCFVSKKWCAFRKALILLKAGSDFAEKNGRKHGIGTTEFVPRIGPLLRNLLETKNQSSIRFDCDTAFILENASFLAFVGRKSHRAPPHRCHCNFWCVITHVSSSSWSFDGPFSYWRPTWTNCSRIDDLEGDLQASSWRQHRSRGKSRAFSIACGGSRIIDSQQRIAEGPDSELGHRARKVRNEQVSGWTTCPNRHRNKSSTIPGNEKLVIWWIKPFQSRVMITAQSYCLDYMALWWANLSLFRPIFHRKHHGAAWRQSQPLNDKSVIRGLQSESQLRGIRIEPPVSHSN